MVVTRQRPTPTRASPLPALEAQLQYISPSATTPESLPLWAAIMTRIGADLAEVDPTQQPLVVGVTLPARGFAAALSAAAHVLRRNELDPVEPDDPDAHFDDLCALPEGTAIKFMLGGRLHEGRLLGRVERDGKEFLKIKTRGVDRFLPKKVALDVQMPDVARDSGQDLRSRRIDVPPLLAGLVDGPTADAYASRSRVDCILVGTLTALTADLTAREFVVAESRSDVGCLQDLVRAQDVAGAAAGSRSALVAGGTDEADLPSLEPHLVVFDGGRGYTRLGHRWPSSHHLVVLDRSSAQAEPAAEALNFAYFERAGDHNLGGRGIPPSMELLAFEARR